MRGFACAFLYVCHKGCFITLVSSLFSSQHKKGEECASVYSSHLAHPKVLCIFPEPIGFSRRSFCRSSVVCIEPIGDHLYELIVVSVPTFAIPATLERVVITLVIMVAQSSSATRGSDTVLFGTTIMMTMTCSTGAFSLSLRHLPIRVHVIVEYEALLRRDVPRPAPLLSRCQWSIRRHLLTTFTSTKIIMTALVLSVVIVLG